MSRSTRLSRLRTAAAIAASGALLGVAACSPTATTSGTSAGGDEPQSGGTLRVGIVGGSAKDTLDAHSPVTHPDEARAIQLYDTLATYDTDHEIELVLAEEITPSSDAKSWTVTLREGLKFSDGSPITAEDVAFTFKRVTNPEDPKAGAEALATLDRDAIQVKDDRTIVFPFTKPFSVFEEAVAYYAMGIVPTGYDPKKPVSSGPFALDSFTPGKESTFVKNEHYWREGEPHLDAVTIIDFPDDTARVNALLGGQVDAIDQLPLGQVKVVEADPRLEVLESPSGSWLPLTMRVDQAPFDDPKVREAFRLIVDRQQMIDQVLDGHGTIGNDMYAPLDSCYPEDIPQREQDIDKAKQLLAEAGQSDLQVDLVTSPVAAGMVESAQVFAQQAKEAGVDVNVKKVDTGVFYGDQYLQWTFAQDFWFTRDYLTQAAQGSLPNAPYNETHWADEEWIDLVDEASATVDEDKRCELIKEAQQIEYERGGYIVWGFPNTLDAHTASVHGFEKDPSGIPLSSYNFRSVWLSE